MLLLDTNALSALVRTEPDAAIAGWLSAQREPWLCTAAICQAELWAGISIMPDDRRRIALEQAVHAMFVEEFEERVLPFDVHAAFAYADMFAARRRAGRPSATTDLMIAAIARIHGASVVTRNVRAFEGCGVPAINPCDT